MEAFDEVFIHYKRKEELLFPHLERHDITGPSKVMWGKDDEVRNAVHGAEALLETAYGEYDSQLLAGVADYLDEAVEGALSMVSKEENVLIPLSLEHLSATQWTQIASEENEFGHAFGINPPTWHADPLELANDKLNEMEAVRTQKQPLTRALLKMKQSICLPASLLSHNSKLCLQPFLWTLPLWMPTTRPATSAMAIPALSRAPRVVLAAMCMTAIRPKAKKQCVAS